VSGCEYRDSVASYLLGSLPEDEHERFAAHLPGCEACSRDVAELGVVADTLPLGDRISREAVRHFYGLTDEPDDERWASIAAPWRPYRMWSTVLLHMAWRRDQPAVPSYRQGRGRPAD